MSIKEYLIPDKQAERSMKIGIAVGIFACLCVEILEMLGYLS